MQFQESGAALLSNPPQAPMTGRLIGEITWYASATVPPGWLICQGQAVSRTTYANLFAVIGTTWGAGDGSTTFNVPNLADRVPVGALYSYPIAQLGGENTHQLVDGEMPQHNHSSPTGTESAWHQHGISDPGHGHWTSTRDYAYGSSPGSGGDYVALGAANTTFRANSDSRAVVANGTGVSAGNQNALHTHGIAIDGNNQPHNNMQAYAAVNAIVYAGA